MEPAFPILVTGASAIFQNGTSGNISLIGVDISQLNFVLDSSKIVAGKPAGLEVDGAVSGELYEKSNLGDNVNVGTPFEISGRRAFFCLANKGISWLW